MERLGAPQLERILEAALMAADEPLSVRRLAAIFKPGELDPAEGRKHIREALGRLAEGASGRGYELKQVASGYRFQVRQEVAEWVSRLWQEKPPRYSRALLETLALIVYKQPVTRADIERIRGVGVSQNIMRTLLERGWVRVLGQREVPGRPNLYGSTRAFLDYFNLKSLDDLPPLAEIEALMEPLVEELGPDGDRPAEGGKGMAEGALAETGQVEPSQVGLDQFEPDQVEPSRVEPGQIEHGAEGRGLANVVPLRSPR